MSKIKSSVLRSCLLTVNDAPVLYFHIFQWRTFMLMNFIISANALFASARSDVVDVADFKIVNIQLHLHSDRLKWRQAKTTLHQYPEKLKLVIQQLLFQFLYIPLNFYDSSAYVLYKIYFYPFNKSFTA